jgi:hypothetical protein
MAILLPKLIKVAWRSRSGTQLVRPRLLLIFLEPRKGLTRRVKGAHDFRSDDLIAAKLLYFSVTIADFPEN